jgi:hypothetical protein
MWQEVVHQRASERSASHTAVCLRETLCQQGRHHPAVSEDLRVEGLQDQSQLRAHDESARGAAGRNSMTTTTYTPSELKSFRIRADITIGAAAIAMTRLTNTPVTGTELSRFENERVEWPEWKHLIYATWLLGEGATP